MDILIKAGQLITGLSILVIIHELGHFLAARAFGIRVEKFYLFFDAWGFKLFKFKKGGTEYGIGWLPLGGYVKIAGMIDESMDKEFINKPAEDWEFRSKPVWQRLIVILGGIFMNVILGIVIFSLYTWHYGETYIKARDIKYGIEVTPYAKTLGLQNGDKILSINDKEVKRDDDLTLKNSDFFLKKDIVLHIDRNGTLMDIKLPQDFGNRVVKEMGFVGVREPFHVGDIEPKTAAEKAGLKENDRIIGIDDKEIQFFGELTETLQAKKGKDINIKIQRGNPVSEVVLHAKVDTQGHLGFHPVPELKESTDYFGLAQSFQMGSEKAWNAVSVNVGAIKRIILGELPSNSLHSFIGIANFYGAKWDWRRFWTLTGMLSMMLAFFNFLPIPALDGGYVIFLLIELFRGKAVSYKVLEVAQIVGISLLVLLMGFAFYNDIFR